MNQRLLTRIRQGDTQAFAQMVTQLQHPLFSYLGRMGLEQAVAEDIAQETFIRAWQARDRFDEERSAYSTWIFTIARRLAINELERSWRYHERAEADNEQLVSDDGLLNQPHSQLQIQEVRLRLQAALNALPVHERSLLALAYINGLELADIARIEDIPTGTVKSRLHRIRSKLKTLIGSPE
ncbi:MAG: RNA polymerase sigma factor [Thiolinea sp.]